jgi:copper chaperone CopZ
MIETTMTIGGMHCAHCVSKISKALAAVPGTTVLHVEVGSATVRYDATHGGFEALAEAVRSAGYEVETAVR